MNQDSPHINVIPVDYPNSSSQANLTSQHSRQGRTRSGQAQKAAQPSHRKKNKMKSGMDSDYREFYRERPRGEFLTRGAALSTQQQQQQDFAASGGLAAVVPPPQVVRGTGAGAGGGGGGGGVGGGAATAAVDAATGAIYSLTHQQQHDQLEREPRRYVTSTELVRGGRAAIQQQQQQQAKEGRGGRNVPTILRKKMDICVYLMAPVGLKMEIEEGATVTAAEVVQSLSEDDRLGLPPTRTTAEVFALWMTSPLLEVQLRPHHKPYFIRREWNHFLQRFSSAPLERKAADEPILSLQRNIFFPKREEIKLRDTKILELLYEEAKYSVLTGRYPCEISDYIMLGGIQARLELKAYDATVHTPAYFRTIMYRFLPEHASVSGNWSASWLSWRSGAKNSPESRLIEQFKAIPTNASPKRLVRKYLEFCWSLPYYGSAFFHGQIETPARSLTSLLINRDTEVLVAINPGGFYVIDPANVVVLLGLKLEELSWDYAKPSQENNEDCLPCLFIQFCVIESGRRVSKILQIFSRQAIQMDALIATFVDDYKQRTLYNPDDPDGNLFNDSSSGEADDCLVPLTTVSRRGIPESCLSNKLNRLTLATFDDEGHCIGHMGSWSFSN